VPPLGNNHAIAPPACGRGQGAAREQMPEASGPRRNAEIVRNVGAPEGFGRRRMICGAAVTRRWHRIAFIPAAYISPRGAPNDGMAIPEGGH
jgi:hypothetical protein